MRLDFEAIGRVCEAVRSTHVSIPLDLEMPSLEQSQPELAKALMAVVARRDALSGDLIELLQTSDVWKELSDDGLAKERAKAIADIEKGARHLRALFQDAELQLPHILRLGPNLGALVAELEIIEQVAGKELKRRKAEGLDRASVLNLISSNEPNLSPSQLFFQGIAEIYTRFFDRPAGTSSEQDGQEPGGPFIRFVEAVLIEVDRPKKRATIRKAFQRSGYQGGQEGSEI